MRSQYTGLLFIWLFSLSLLTFQCVEPVQTEPLQEEVTTDTLREDANATDTTSSEPRAEFSLESKIDQSDAASPEPTQEPTQDIVHVEPRPEPQAPEPEPIPEPTPSELVQEKAPDGPFSPPGFGAISGDCRVLDDTEWKSSNSFLFRNAIDFGTAAFDEKKLTQGGQKIWKDGNLGGSSVLSEIFAYEILSRCEMAILLKSEVEITYKDAGGKKTDILLEIDTYKIGVSVTRAYQYPPTSPYTVEKATALLTKKLNDIVLSASNATAQDAWSRSILHILAYNKQHADAVEAAYKTIDIKVKADTILIVTVTDGNDEHIYKN